MDVRGETGDSRNFLWKLEETYDVSIPIIYIQYLWENDSVYEFDPPSDSLNHVIQADLFQRFIQPLPVTLLPTN